MKIYLVGGAIRDELLGLPIKERDWVVVGATVNDMQARGFRQVGKEFPVFLHPDTNEEYALARKERKIDAGYQGFSFDTAPTVTLEADLERRDLTINAMAKDATGKLIDPYHGQIDLQNKCLRHVSKSFVEDPVRILRVARFLARYASLGFTIAPETMALMQQMVKAGEVNALVAERVWKELVRALGEKNPEQFFIVLQNAGAFPILFPGLTPRGKGHDALLAAVQLSGDPMVRFAAFLYAENDDVIRTLAKHYRIPNAYRELVFLTSVYHTAALQAKTATPLQLLTLFSALDIYRRKQRFNEFLMTTEAIALANKIHFDTTWLLDAAEVVSNIDIKPLLHEGLSGNTLAARIKELRLQRITAWLQEPRNTSG